MTRYTPDPENAREHPERNKTLIRQSLEEIGAGRSILISGDNTIIAGNGVYEQAQKLGLTIREVEAGPDELIAVKRNDLTGERAIRAAILDNATGDSSTWDMEALRQLDAAYPDLLAGLDEVQAELSAALEAMLPEAGEGGDEFDTTPDDQGETRCKTGDLFLIGGKHRLIVGDSTDPPTVARLMQGERADAVVTDPPYGMNLDTEYSGITLSEKARAKHSVQRDYAPVIGDNEPYNPAQLMQLFADVKEQYWFGADYYRKYLPEGGSWLVWDKRVGVEDVTFDTASFELCWSKTPHRREIIRARWMGLIGMESQDTERRVHPTQKPLEVYLWIFENRTERDALIIDLYLGSGTALVAAHRTNRRCYGIEISEKYADVILRRCEAEGLSVERAEPR